MMSANHVSTGHAIVSLSVLVPQRARVGGDTQGSSQSGTPIIVSLVVSPGRIPITGAQREVLILERHWEEFVHYQRQKGSLSSKNPTKNGLGVLYNHLPYGLSPVRRVTTGGCLRLVEDCLARKAQRSNYSVHDSRPRTTHYQ